MAVPELNEDVLTIVCDFLSNVSDVCAISLTCTSFRMVAIRRLLSIRPIHLKSGAAIRQFHTFLFADAVARAPLVRALDIEPETRPSEDVSLLNDILTSCQQLECISLCRKPSLPRLTEYPGLIDAIVSIESLRSLSFKSPAFDALAIVHRIHAPLRTLGLWCWYPDESESEFGFNWYPAAFQESLSHLASTLEELGFIELIVDPEYIQQVQEPDSDAPLLPVFSWTQYPTVRSLSVNMFPGRPLLGSLRHLFPALDGTLTVRQTLYDNLSVEILPRLRATNQHVQEHEDENGDSYSRQLAWKKLDRVVCSVVTFYVLGLRCPIRLAILDATVGYYTHDVVQHCAAVALRENPIPRLSLVLDDELRIIDGLFSCELGATLTHLTLALETFNPWPSNPHAVPFGWDEFLGDSLLCSLRPLHKLTHLRIVLYAEGPEDINIDANTDAPLLPPDCTISEKLGRALHPAVFDFAGTAAALAQPLPSLQFLFLTTCGHFARREKVGDTTNQIRTGKRWSVSRAWRVAEPSVAVDKVQVRERGQLALVELQDVVAEAIIEREELVLPDACKTWFS